jgi:hypothetical protein
MRLGRQQGEVAPRQPDEIESPREVGPSALPDHDSATDQRDPRADPSRALPPAETDLPGAAPGQWKPEA